MKTMPSDLEAEERILTWLKEHPFDIIFRCGDRIKSTDFYSEANRTRYEEIRIQVLNAWEQLRLDIDTVVYLADRREKIQQHIQEVERLYER